MNSQLPCLSSGAGAAFHNANLTRSREATNIRIVKLGFRYYIFFVLFISIDPALTDVQVIAVRCSRRSDVSNAYLGLHNVIYRSTGRNTTNNSLGQRFIILNNAPWHIKYFPRRNKLFYHMMKEFYPWEWS